jgi:hypothetical protein
MVQHTYIRKSNTAYKQKQDKNHMILSTDPVKALDKIEHIFIIKAPEKTRNRRNILQHNKDSIQQTYSQHHITWGKTETIFSKVRNEPKMPTFPSRIQYSFRITSQSNKTKARNKRDSNSHLFVDDMILYLKYTKTSTKNY